MLHSSPLNTPQNKLLSRATVVAIALTLPFVVGCAGELDPGGTPAWEPMPDMGSVGGGADSTLGTADQFVAAPDQPPTPPSQTGGGAATDSGPQPAPDASPAPDQLLPDYAAAKSDVVGPPGGACPCGALQVCINNKCRQMCTPPKDACKAVSSCTSAEACVPTNVAGLSVCMPGGAGPGQACKGTFCRNNYVCGAVNKGPFRCLPVCSFNGAPCGAGGKCVKTSSGCMFCTKP